MQREADLSRVSLLRGASFAMHLLRGARARVGEPLIAMWDTATRGWLWDVCEQIPQPMVVKRWRQDQYPPESWEERGSAVLRPRSAEPAWSWTTPVRTRRGHTSPIDVPVRAPK